MSAPAGTGLLDLLAAGAHARSRFRILDRPGAEAQPLEGLWARGERAAGALLARYGTAPVVATTLHASEDSLACLLGTWLAGGRLVSLPGRARGQDGAAYRQQVDAALRATGARALLAADPSAEELQDLTTPVAALSSLDAGPAQREAVPGGDLVQFSSGTTGVPKGIVLTLDAIAANVGAILDRLDLEGPGVSCSWLPLSHDMGLVGMCLVPWAAFGPTWQETGEMILIPTDQFVRNPSSWLRACAEHGATVTTAPTFAYELVGRRLNPDRALDLRSLRACIVGAEPVRPDALTLFSERCEPFGLDPTALCPAYGLAEAALAVSLHQPGVPWRTHGLVDDDGVQVAPSVVCGRPLDGMEVTAADPSRTSALRVRGPSLFSGYLGQPPHPAGAWHDTGDLGRLDGGDVVVAGRADDMLFVGGLKLAAPAVERAAERAPGARSDGSAAVQSSSTSYTVVVERRSGGTARAAAQDLGHAVRAEIMADLGRGPAEVVVVPPSSLPRTPSGKIQRFRVRALLDAGELRLDARVVFKAGQAANTDR